MTLDHPVRVPRMGKNRFVGAMEKILRGLKPMDPERWREFPRLPSVHARVVLCQLKAVLYERHWTDHQLWYMMEWRSYGLKDFPDVQEEIIRLLRSEGYAVQTPEPPQTNTSILITWRAALYFNEQ